MEQAMEDGHAEVEDEILLDKQDGITDEAANEATADINFSITSYGADYPVDTLVKRMKGEAFFIPKFQRNFVWSQRHASRFIESLLMGLPVPGIFLYKEADTGKHLVVDGQQRLRSLQYFYSGVFGEKAFKLIGVRKQWEDKGYEQLEANERLRLDDSIVHATIFQQEEPKHTLKSLYFVFERINSGGIRLSPQEIRNCISDSVILELVKKLNDDANWRAIFGEKKNNRLKDQELILRALAMIYSRSTYSAPMRDFLNDFAADEKKEATPKKLELMDELFRSTMTLFNAARGKNAFRLYRALNAAVLEAMVVGLAERLLSKKAWPTADEVGKIHDGLMDDKAFIGACISATATVETVKLRQKLDTRKNPPISRALMGSERFRHDARPQAG
jgi:hypothetical protein